MLQGLLVPRPAVLLGTACLLCAAVLGGYASTELLVDSGVEPFTGYERAAAEEALEEAQSSCVEHVENLLRWKMQVVDVELGPESCPYRAELRTYTVFGIPTGRILVLCGTRVDCQR